MNKTHTYNLDKPEIRGLEDIKKLETLFKKLLDTDKLRFGKLYEKNRQKFLGLKNRLNTAFWLKEHIFAEKRNYFKAKKEKDKRLHLKRISIFVDILKIFPPEYSQSPLSSLLSSGIMESKKKFGLRSEVLRALGECADGILAVRKILTFLKRVRKHDDFLSIAPDCLDAVRKIAKRIEDRADKMEVEGLILPEMEKAVAKAKVTKTRKEKEIETK